MKHLLQCLLVPLIIVSCSQEEKNKTALIKGSVLTENVAKINFNWIVDNPISGKGNTYSADVDSKGQFSIEIPIDRMATGQIEAGGFYHQICLIPGDNFTMKIEGDTIQFDGKGANKNNFLYATEKNGLWDQSFFWEMNRCELPLNDLFENLIQFKQKRLAFFRTYIDTVELQKEFVKYYEVITQVYFEQIIQQYPEYYAHRNNTPLIIHELPYSFKAYRNFAKYVDDTKVFCPEYLNNLRNNMYSKINEVVLADSTLSWPDAKYTILFDSLSGKTQEYLLTKWICSEFSQDRYDTLAINKFNEIEKDELAKSTFQQAFEKYNAKHALLGQPLHREFSETLLFDTSETKLTFGEMMNTHKGKVVYLDIWSLNCGPCIAAMPDSKKLKEKLSGLPIEFIYLAQDAPSNDVWNRIFEKSFTNKNHFRTVDYQWGSSRMLKFMEINWVPCYMIFDKEGKLVDFNADRPMNVTNDIVSQLEQTLHDLAVK